MDVCSNKSSSSRRKQAAAQKGENAVDTRPGDKCKRATATARVATKQATTGKVVREDL